MSAPYSAYLELLEELRGHLERLSELAQQKAAVVRQDDLIALDEVLKREQVVSLALRGLEQRRARLVKELGLENTTLSDLPGRCPAELDNQARRIVRDLRDSYEIYRGYADMARNTLELNLHQIEKFIVASGGDPADIGAGYEAPGPEPPRNMKTDFRA